MSNDTNRPIAIFTHPSISVLIRNVALLRRAETIILYQHRDQRHPAFLDTCFVYLANKLCGHLVETRTVQQFHHSPFSAEVVSALHDEDVGRYGFVRWLRSSLNLGADAACRYARRVSLERCFLHRMATEAVRAEFDARNVLFYSTTNTRLMDVSADLDFLKGLNLFDQLLGCAAAPFVFYLRLLREFSAVSFTLTNTTMGDFDLVVYEVGFRHKDMRTDLNLSNVKSMHNKNSSSLVYVHNKGRTCQFISDIWRPPHTLIASYKSALRKDGYNYCDWADFKISLRLFLKLHGIWARASLLSLLHLKSVFEVFDMARAIGLYAREFIFFENIKTAGVLGFDDYSERTIIRKHVASVHNAKSLCVQHSANDGIRSGAELATVDAHHYLTLAKFTRDSFHRYWSQDTIIQFGYPRLDEVYQELTSRSSVDTPFTGIPNPGKPIVTIALPNIRTHKTFRATIPGADDLIKFLEIAHHRYKESLNIYLRPKQMVGWEETIEIIGFPVEHLLVDRDILTAEYIYFSDLVICSVGSGIMSESALLKTNFVLFDVVKSPTDIYDDFGDGFYNETAEDMIRQLDLLANGEEMDVDHAKAQRLFSDPYNPDRAKLIFDLIAVDAPDYSDRNIPQLM